MTPYGIVSFSMEFYFSFLIVKVISVELYYRGEKRLSLQPGTAEKKKELSQICVCITVTGQIPKQTLS